MSRIGKTIINVPNGVTVSHTGNLIVVKGPKGELSFEIPHGFSLKAENNVVSIISPKTSDKKVNAEHGFLRANLANQVKGVTEGWTRTLELSGVGYRASVEGVNLVLTIGFSHPVTIIPPSGIVFTIQDGKILVSGNDKQVVGQTAANIRAIKKPEPYKGKGIKYLGEHIRKKAGKSAKAVGGAPGAK